MVTRADLYIAHDAKGAQIKFPKTNPVYFMCTTGLPSTPSELVGSTGVVRGVAARDEMISMVVSCPVGVVGGKCV